MEKVSDLINVLYMEKIALNAQEARAMAARAGLFPEGQWRWALRNLRDSRGNLLQGRELSDAKMGLGSLSNNELQKTMSLSRRMAGDAGEVGVLFQDRAKPLVIKGKQHTLDADDFANKIDSKSSFKNFTHTHPGTEPIVVKDIARKYPDIIGETDLLDSLHPVQYTRPSGIKALSRGELEGDAGAMYQNPHVKHFSIVGPKNRVESVSHFRNENPNRIDWVRSIYFDRSPRKMRDMEKQSSTRWAREYVKAVDHYNAAPPSSLAKKYSANQAEEIFDAVRRYTRRHLGVKQQELYELKKKGGSLTLRNDDLSKSNAEMLSKKMRAPGNKTTLMNALHGDRRKK